MTQSVESRNVAGQVVYGISAEDLTKAIAALISSGALHVAQMAAQPGDIDALWAKQAGLIFEPVIWTPSADGQIITGDCAVLGFRVLAGTSPTLVLYDGTSTSGTKIFDGGGALTVGQFYPILGAAGGAPAAAARCASGLYGDQGGTTPSFLFWVLRSQP